VVVRSAGFSFLNASWIFRLSDVSSVTTQLSLVEVGLIQLYVVYYLLYVMRLNAGFSVVPKNLAVGAAVTSAPSPTQRFFCFSVIALLSPHGQPRYAMSAPRHAPPPQKYLITVAGSAVSSVAALLAALPSVVHVHRRPAVRTQNVVATALLQSATPHPGRETQRSGGTGAA